MILDARTIALFFVDGLSGLALLLLAWIAWRSRLGRRPAGELEELWPLLALALGLLLFLRGVAWASFFLVLDGYVPGLAENGVMCAFGVVQLRPELAHFALWSKPAGALGLLAWWAVSAAQREASAAPFQRLLFAAALPVAVLAGVDVVAELRWLCADKLALEVTCCRSALDPTRAAEWFRSTAIFGLSSSSLLALLFAAKGLLIGACAAVARRKPEPRLGWTLALCASSCAVAFLDLDAWREAIAPRALGLDFHRCAYELVTRSVALGPVALLAALAHLGLCVLPVLALVRSREIDGATRTSAWISAAAALGLATELVVLAVHVVL